MAKKTSEKMTKNAVHAFSRLRDFVIMEESLGSPRQFETSLGFRASVGNHNMRKYKVGDRLLGKLSGGRIVEATAKAVDDVVSGHAS